MRHEPYSAPWWLERIEEASARLKAGKKMLDTSKKYKVGSVVYEWSQMNAFSGLWVSGLQKSIFPPAMQQLYDDGLAVEVKEPFEKTIQVNFDSTGGGTEPTPFCNVIRALVGTSKDDFTTVAKRTFDVTIKERF